MSYQTSLQHIYEFAPPAVDLLFQEYSEAAVSWDKERVVAALMAKLKLDAPDINSEADAYNELVKALAILLASGKIQPKAFGYSSLGAEEVNELFRITAAPEPPKVVTVQDQYADIIRDYQFLSSGELQEKKNRTPGYLARFNEAVLAGAI